MAYLEVYKAGKLVKKKQIDEAVAQNGYKMNLGQDKSVVLKTGQSKTVGKYTLKLLADIPEETLDTKADQAERTEPIPSIVASKPADKSTGKYYLLAGIAVAAVVLMAAGMFVYIGIARSKMEDESAQTFEAVRREFEAQKAELAEELSAVKEKAGNNLQEFGGRDIKKFTLSGDELFGPGSAKLKTAAMAKIKGIGRAIKRNYADCEVLVAGYTDTDKLHRAETKKLFGDNWNLGSQRALAVLRVLEKEGIAGKKLYAISRGPFHPKQNKAESRRVEIVLRLPRGADSHDRSVDEQIVHRLAQDFIAGVIEDDPVLFANAMDLLADDFTGIMSDGTTVRGKQKAIDFYRQAAQGTHSAISDLEITYQIESAKMGIDNATTFGKLTLSGQVKKGGQFFSSEIWETLTFQKIDNSWRLTMEHSTGAGGKSASQQAKEQLVAAQNDANGSGNGTESEIDKNETVTQQQVREIREAIGGSITGIGVQIKKVEDGILVEKVSPNLRGWLALSPAIPSPLLRATALSICLCRRW